MGEYAPGENDNLYFEVGIPSSLDNRYELLNPIISLVFSKDSDEQNSSTNGRWTFNPNTWDSIDGTIIIFFISAIGLIIVIFLVYKEKQKEE